MRTKITLVKFIFFLLLSMFVLFMSCGPSGLKFNGKPISFDRVGYFKGDNNVRYFTFYINTQETIDRNNIPEELLKLTKEHGSKQMNTGGRVTASFYYLERSKTPDITALTADKANDLAHEMKPIISVWIMPNGQINQFKNPE
jgi:hypothetical protein